MATPESGGYGSVWHKNSRLGRLFIMPACSARGGPPAVGAVLAAVTLQPETANGACAPTPQRGRHNPRRPQRRSGLQRTTFTRNNTLRAPARMEIGRETCRAIRN